MPDVLELRERLSLWPAITVERLSCSERQFQHLIAATKVMEDQEVDEGQIGFICS